MRTQRATSKPASKPSDRSAHVMTIRTAHRTVTFTRPFKLDGVDGMQPAGSYQVDTDEESIDSLTFIAWRRVGTTIHLPRDGAVSAYRIDPVDLDVTLLHDAGLTVRPVSPD